MDCTDLTEFDDGFTIKLAGPPGLIAVDTLIETLAGFKQSLEAIGDAVDPNYHLEVFVDRVSPGSVNIGVRLKQHLRKNAKAYALAAGVIATPGVHRDIIVGLFSNYLYDQIKPQQECDVDVGPDVVIVKGSNCNVRIRRQVYDLKPLIEGDPRVAGGVERALKAVKKDDAVQSVGVSSSPETKPAVLVPRPLFDEALHRLQSQPEFFYQQRLASMPAERFSIVHETRTRTVRADLTVIKAVLMRGKRKWQFNWNGIKVSARITDANFFDQLEVRSIALRQGDALDGDLEITQRFLPQASVWQNHHYKVTKVYRVRVGDTQQTMDFTSPLSGSVSSLDPAKWSVGDVKSVGYLPPPGK